MGLDPVSSILDIGKSLIDKLIPDPQAKAAATQKLLEMQQSGDLAVIAGQNRINEIEAANPRIFVSGWRPFIGWVCGSALAFQLIFTPLGMWASGLAGHPTQFPALNTELLTTLVISMLGMGGLRTYEKLNKVETK